MIVVLELALKNFTATTSGSLPLRFFNVATTWTLETTSTQSTNLGRLMWKRPGH